MKSAWGRERWQTVAVVALCAAAVIVAIGYRAWSTRVAPSASGVRSVSVHFRSTPSGAGVYFVTAPTSDHPLTAPPPICTTPCDGIFEEVDAPLRLVARKTGYYDHEFCILPTGHPLYHLDLTRPTTGQPGCGYSSRRRFIGSNGPSEEQLFEF